MRIFKNNNLEREPAADKIYARPFDDGAIIYSPY